MQLALLPSPVEPTAAPPTGACDLGLYLTGEIERPPYLPPAVPLGTVREVVRGCGCRRRERMGFVGWLSAGRVRLCGEHRIWQEAT